MTNPTKEMAANIARTINAPMCWEDIRELCEQKTGGELDAFQLDMLADWTQAVHCQAYPDPDAIN